MLSYACFSEDMGYVDSQLNTHHTKGLSTPQIQSI